MKVSRLARTLALICTGGALMQVGSCGAALFPLVFSFAESSLLSLLFGGALGTG